MSRASILTNISALFFNVRITGGIDNGGLSPGAIAGIVIGSILAFLLACLLIALCVWCCCYRLGWCLWCCFCCPCFASCCRCCPARGKDKKITRYTDQTSSKSRLYSSRRYESDDRQQSGFEDFSQQKTRPNYVINSISKSTSSICDINHQLDACKSSNDFYQIAPVTVESSSWRVPKPAHPCTSTSYQDMMTTIDQETHVYNVSTRKQNPYVVTSNNNEAFVGDSCNNLTSHHQHHHHHVTQITPPCSPKIVNKRVVETSQYLTSNRYGGSQYHPSGCGGDSGGEVTSDNYFNQVCMETGGQDNYQQMSGKQYKNIPITVTTTTTNGVSAAASGPVVVSSYSKYDSDV